WSAGRRRPSRGLSRRATCPRRLLRTLAFLASVAAGTAAVPARAATSRDRLMIEVHRDAAPLIDVRATQRLVELETADVDVPPPPKLDFRPPLYFRIVALSAATLRVELWELGQPRGARSVSAAGNDMLKARRIALAAAELARRLRQQRLSEIRTAEQQPKEVEDEKKRSGVPIYGRLA